MTHGNAGGVSPIRHLVGGLLNAFVAKDIETVLGFFADDAVVFDPHYPIMEMQGIAAIRRGFAWALGNMERPGFVVRQALGNAHGGAVEVDAHHIFRGGLQIRFIQVFVFALAAGKVVSLRAYVPYPPSGIAALLTRLTRLLWRLKGKS